MIITRKLGSTTPKITHMVNKPISEILSVFTDPTIVIDTNLMNVLYENASMSNASKVTYNCDELTIQGNNWLYFNKPDGFSKLYVRGKLNNVDAQSFYIDLVKSDSEAETQFTPSRTYILQLRPLESLRDFRIWKYVDGNWTEVVYEAVDLSNNTYYDVEVLYDSSTDRIKVWRDGVLKFDISVDTVNSDAFRSVRFRIDGNNLYGKITAPVVVMYE
jgi:hypothetical protein